MTNRSSQPPIERRSFLTRLSIAGGAFISSMAGTETTAQAQSTAGTHWQPVRHELDDWMDKIPGKHRMIVDTISPDGFGLAILFSNNYYIANQTGYGLKDSDLALIVVARHNSTPFAFNDAMWAKYGDAISKRAGFNDPKTKDAPKRNLYNAAEYADVLDNRGVILDAVLKRGTHLAVCQMATRAYARAIATGVGRDADSIYDELAANLANNSHLVPAGIVAVNRAQERGYAFVQA